MPVPVRCVTVYGLFPVTVTFTVCLVEDCSLVTALRSRSFAVAQRTRCDCTYTLPVTLTLRPVCCRLVTFAVVTFARSPRTHFVTHVRYHHRSGLCLAFVYRILHGCPVDCQRHTRYRYHLFRLPLFLAFSVVVTLRLLTFVPVLRIAVGYVVVIPLDVYLPLRSAVVAVIV